MKIIVCHSFLKCHRRHKTLNNYPNISIMQVHKNIDETIYKCDICRHCLYAKR